ncbi:MAG TPA: Rieske 2Fe-2S domain-containing protein [Chloroflexota bacterium]|jgi:carbazole 1,9a-dioxygenase terminal dioxygenase component
MKHDAEPLSDEERSEREVAEAVRTKPWQPYLEAALGFRNHWYPAFFGHELAEGEVRAEQLLGERLFFKRVGGKVYAMEDRCLHRGAPFSARPECYSPNTVTCWYHGFTYDVRDGRLVAVVTDPESALIGKVGIKTYPVEEAKGLVFVFVGDLDPPPRLLLDVQPNFLDADLAIYPRGERSPVASNWRLAAENGFDASHIYIHRNSALIVGQRRALPLATLICSREGMVVAEEGAPKGVVKGSGKRLPIWQTEIEGVPVRPRFLPGEGDFPGRTSPDTSMWLPCGLKVDPFPTPGMIQFEWYVPIDARSHMYTVTWGKYVEASGDAERFYADVDACWKDLVTNHFNNDDVLAREQIERFYAEEDGWHRERLYRPDLIITEWRKLASTHNRGIQRSGQHS